MATIDTKPCAIYQGRVHRGTLILRESDYLSWRGLLRWVWEERHSGEWPAHIEVRQMPEPWKVRRSGPIGAVRGTVSLDGRS